MNRLNPYLKAVVSLIGPAYAATTLAVQQHHGQNWTIVGAAALSSFLVWLVPNLPKLEKEVTGLDPATQRATESERRWIEARKRGGYTGGAALEDMGPPVNVPSASTPAVQPPATGTGSTT